MAIVDDQFDDTKGKKKGNKNLFVILGIVCAVVVIAVVALVLNKDNISSMFGGTVARVDSEAISKTDYKAATVIQVLQYEAYTGTPIWDKVQNGSKLIEQAESAAINFLIQDKVQVTEAKNKKFSLTDADKKTVDTSYNSFISQYKTQYGSYYEDALIRLDLTEKDFNAVIKQLLTDQMLSEKLKKSTLSGFKPKDLIRAQHILITLQKHSDAKAKALAQSILSQVKAGKDFATLAKKYSEDPGSAVNGGDLGYFGKGQMVKPFETAAFALTKVGQVSDLVKTDYGYHIIKLESKGIEDASKLSATDQASLLSNKQFTAYYQKLITSWQKSMNVKKMNTKLDVKTEMNNSTTNTPTATTAPAATSAPTKSK